MPYNPFPRPFFENLTPEDLQLLVTNEVAEGYFVEYKQTFPKNLKIARSIASFANTNGGWYIVGVLEDGHQATCICGFETSQYSDPIGKVREVVKSNIDPVPLFYPQVVRIDDAKAVLAVYVPGNQETPFITLDGRVYRRIADSSDPIMSTDRAALDRLIDQGSHATQSFIKFCTDERTFCEAESNLAWLQVYISPRLLQAPQPLKFDTTTSWLSDLLSSSRTPVPIPLPTVEASATGILPLNLAQPTGQSVILRQVNTGMNSMNSMEIEIFYDGRAKLLIPLQELATDEIDLHSVSKNTAMRYLKAYQDTEPNGYLLRFLDMKTMWQALAILVNYYLSIVTDVIRGSDLRYAMQLQGAWRTVPFMNSPEWSDHIEKCGLPVVMQDDVSVMNIDGAGWLLSHEQHDDLWTGIAMKASLAMGLPIDLAAKGLTSALFDPKAS